MTSDFPTQLYSPVLDIVEHSVDKERNVSFLTQLYSPVLDIVEHSVDKEGNIGFSNSVSGDKSLNKADQLSAHRQILATVKCYSQYQEANFCHKLCNLVEMVVLILFSVA